MTTFGKGIPLLALMIISAVISSAMQPRIFLADRRPKFELKQLLPTSIGEWQELKQTNGQIVNPQQQEKLNALYSQLLTRSYVHASGQQIMLSIAYGRDQRSYMALHYPEVCYPAQGFRVITNQISNFNGTDQTFSVRRLETALGEQRYEPVTYWTTIGDFRSLGGFGKRLIELQYGLNREIPDGVLFRVSSIGRDSDHQFTVQQNFINALLVSVSPDQRLLLIGKSAH
jgi:EpsI family protein